MICGYSEVKIGTVYVRNRTLHDSFETGRMKPSVGGLR